ncbi:MAG: insulinase family protein [Acidobacteriota bacterium]|nr:insulinase family protein [Acidobacteriota bacterium]
MTALAALGAFLAFPIAAQAQGTAQGVTPPSTKGVVPKGRAPVSKEVLKVKLPPATEAHLPNGAHLMVLEDRRAPQVSVQIFIPGAGGYFDPAGMSGLATFTASQMREGTARWTTTQLNEELERLAANVSVSAGVSGTEAVINVSALPEHLDRVMDIAVDVLLHPTFPEAEFARYKQRTKASLQQQRSNPGFLLAEAASGVMYGNHPASRVSLSAEALDKVTRADLVAFHQSKFVPDHAAIAVTGDISMTEARKLVETKLAGWKRANTAVPETIDPPMPGAPKVHFVGRPDSVQTNLSVAAPGISRTSKDFDVLGVMNKVLGGGPTGRLFIVLREDKGYTYGAYSGVTAGLYRGDWTASTSVRTDVTEPALTDLMAEIARMRDEKVPAEDLETAKRAIVAAFALSLESPQAIMGYHLTRWRYKLPVDYWEKEPQRVMAVTADQVQAAAVQYLAPSKLHIVAVGDPAKVADALAKFGVMVKYDTEGKVIK